MSEANPMSRIQKREGSLKEQADQIRFERNLARKDYNNYGGCGYPSTKDESILLSYISQLENEAVCLRRGQHEWYLNSNNGGMYCRQCGAAQSQTDRQSALQKRRKKTCLT